MEDNICCESKRTSQLLAVNPKDTQ